MSELNGDARKLELKIMEVQTRNEERWNAHDKRSEDNWAEIKEGLKVMHNLPCAVHVERMNSFKYVVAGYGVIMLVIVGLFAKHVMGV